METERRTDSRDTGVDKVGTFHYEVPTATLTWSDTLFEIYGYEAGSITPDLEVLMERTHPDDRDAAGRVLTDTLETGTGCVHTHRIVTPSGTVKHIVVVGSGTHNEAGEVTEFAGYAVDVTARTEQVVAVQVTDALHEVLDARIVIEQAKGAMMLAFGVDAKTAFSVLSWQSQQNNIKLRALSEQVVRDIQNNTVMGDRERDAIGSLLLTAHQRARRA